MTFFAVSIQEKNCFISLPGLVTRVFQDFWDFCQVWQCCSGFQFVLAENYWPWHIWTGFFKGSSLSFHCLVHAIHSFSEFSGQLNVWMNDPKLVEVLSLRALTVRLQTVPSVSQHISGNPEPNRCISHPHRVRDPSINNNKPRRNRADKWKMMVFK
jgi:hypothetical protein